MYSVPAMTLQRNRRGADVGTQYRSTIMYLNESQRVIAEAWKKKIASEFNDPIVTEIVKAPEVL